MFSVRHLRLGGSESRAGTCGENGLDGGTFAEQQGARAASDRKSERRPRGARDPQQGAAPPEVRGPPRKRQELAQGCRAWRWVVLQNRGKTPVTPTISVTCRRQ